MQLTPENRMRLRATVFGKTEAGRVEFVQRSAGLTARQRSVLILIDGRKALGEIETWLGEDEMLVGISSAPAPAPVRSPAGAAALAAAREFMMAAARKHLGLMAADLVRRIEHAKDESQLAGVIGLWHVSLRESKTGKPCAEGLLAEARALLA
jgi:hypothetical protein